MFSTSRARRGARILLGCALAVCALAVTPSTVATGATGSTVTAAPAAGADEPTGTVFVAVLPTTPSDALTPAAERGHEAEDRVLRGFHRLGASTGLASTTQGDYDRTQALLDLTQGTRQPASLYGSDLPPQSLERAASGGDTWRFENWADVVRRAHRASVTIEPGLLADSVPGGAAYVGPSTPGPAAVAAADRSGIVSNVSLGSADSLLSRVAEASDRSPLVVADLPGGDAGLDRAADLIRDTDAGDLVILLHLPPTPAERSIGAAPSRFFNQTAIAIHEGGVAPAGAPARLRSATTRQPGLVSLIDVAPTALEHLGIDAPDRMRGQVIRSSGEAVPTSLEGARRRWHDVRSGRQAASLRGIVVGALLIFLVLGAWRGLRAALAPALRMGGLGLLWWPTAALAIAPASIRSGPTESMVIAVVALVVAAATDVVLRWPRAPIAAAAVGITVLTADLANGGSILTRSVLAPSVATGNRFYGISNEIEPVLPVLVLAGIAALGLRDVRKLRWLYAASGVVLAAVVGAGRLGADVGGVITISAAFVVAGFALRPTRPRPRTLLAFAAVPFAALALLIGLDLVAGGGGHLSNNLTRATGGRELWELVARRYELAFSVLLDLSNAVSLGVALLVVGFAVRNRAILLPHVPSPAWTATLVGGFAGGVAGALSNDSGPVLLTNAVVALAAVAAYLRGWPSPVVAGGRSAGEVALAAVAAVESEPSSRLEPIASDG